MDDYEKLKRAVIMISKDAAAQAIQYKYIHGSVAENAFETLKEAGYVWSDEESLWIKVGSKAGDESTNPDSSPVESS